LAQARQLGASLVVALNTDDSIRLQHKGKMRPIVPLSERLQVIAALAAVDVVTYFEAATPIELISSIMPDVLVKGRDWTISSIVGADIVLQAGGSVHSIPFVHHTSTTAIIQRIITHSSK
jgi:rfaE bifunctional protein nucleotidyltransferase chain/domain